jgi:hypothetical protein
LQGANEVCKELNNVKTKQAATVRNGAEGVANSLNDAINTERSGVSSSRMCEAKIENIP